MASFLEIITWGLCQFSWSESNRLSNISLAQMGLFRINRELQFSLQPWPATGKSLHSKEGVHFYREKGSWEVTAVFLNDENVKGTSEVCGSYLLSSKRCTDQVGSFNCNSTKNRSFKI